MKTRTMLILLVILSGTSVFAHAQAGGGKAYDSRDPFVCKSTKDPAHGGPSSGQVNDYVRCTNESISGGYIALFENVQGEAGKSRPYSAWYDSGNGDIDNSEPVYPIRGTYDLYSCRPPGSMGFPAGNNCNVKKGVSFEGTCYKTTFGDWKCPVKTMGDPLSGWTYSVPPPKS